MMPSRLRVAVAALALVGAITTVVPQAALAVADPSPFKLALIVGPMGSETSHNRSDADQLASEAAALGVTVTKAYSPNATYANVRAAVAGANVIVYFGHGNGYPNPYNSKLLADRDDGWGLNTTTTHGDADSWSAGTMVYCGEKVLEGKLTSTDGAEQRTYCKGGGIAPAPGFVMVYVGSCYSAGSNEPQNPEATSSEAVAHAAYFSRPILSALGGSGYFAGRSEQVVMDLLSNPDKSYGDIFNENMPSGITAAYDMAQPLVSGAREWLTHQTGNPWWYYAFAGDPSRTLNGGTSTYTAPADTLDSTPPKVTSRTPASGATGVDRHPLISVTFSEAVNYVRGTTVTLWKGSSQVSATVAYDPGTLTATLTPPLLALGGTYTVKLLSTIRDLAGNRLASTSWSFRVVTSVTISPARQMTFSAGKHTGYRFSSTGAVLGSKTKTLTATASATATKEAVIAGHSGLWLYVSSGTWSGYWVQVSSSVKLG